MRYDLDEIQRLPDVLSLADLCRACHLSHLDARYYLKSGLIPLRDNREENAVLPGQKNRPAESH